MATLNGFPALSGVSLEVAPKEIVFLRGGNGAGKSTMLRLCAGLIPVHSGSARVAGVDVSDRSNRRLLRSKVELLGHELGLYEDLSVIENLEFWADINRVERSSVRLALEKVALPERTYGLAVSELSAGQKRRCSLAKIIIKRPQIWLLDEPYAGLDTGGVAIVDSLITDARHAGATCIFTSHDQKRGQSIADRTVELSGGEIVPTSTLPAPPQKGVINAE